MAASGVKLQPGEVDLLSPAEIEPVKYLTLPQQFSGKFRATNYRLIFTVEGETLEIPIGAVARYETVEMGKVNGELVLHCRDLRVERFQFPMQLFKQLNKKVVKKLSAKSAKDTYAYKYRGSGKGGGKGWTTFIIDDEYFGRQQVEPDRWTVSLANSTYDLCKMYPREFLVPQSTRDTDLWRVAIYRGEGRIPLLSWYSKEKRAILLRASRPNPILLQDMVGMTPVRNEADQRYVQQLLETSISEQMYVLNIIDTDDKAGMGQLGECVDESYPNCLFFNEPLPPVPGVITSFLRMQALCTNLLDTKHANFRRDLRDTDWVENIRLIHAQARRLAQWLCVGQSVLVQSRDGDDACAQISSLAQLLLDSHTRTIEGFAVLVEKEWIYPGHRFVDLTKHSGRTVEEQKLYPVSWIQFLDCVWQLLRTYPSAFEFNESFLVALFDGLLSFRYGTFMGYCERSRASDKLVKNTESIWTELLDGEHRPRFASTVYDKSRYDEVLPLDDPAPVAFWSSLYLRYTFCHPLWEGNRSLVRRIQDVSKARSVDMTLAGHHVTIIDQNLLQCQHIKTLILRGNYISSLPADFFQALPAMEVLDLSENFIGSIAEATLKLAEKGRLRYLNLADNGLEFLPESLAPLRGLEELNLKNNSLTRLGDVSDLGDSLLEFDASHNELREVVGIFELRSVRKLVLSHNRLEKLDKSLVGLVELETLDLRENLLTDCPNGLAELSRLSLIDLSGNPIDTSLGMSYQITPLFCCRRLHSIRLASLGLTKFPSAFPSELAKLRVVDLQNNKMTLFPAALLEMEHMTVLFLNNNLIEVIPFEICRLHRLRRLAVCDNKLSFITSGLGKLEQLEVLEMHNNLIEELPPALATLPLRQWTFDNNPISNVPPEVLRGGTADILAYLRTLLSGSQRLYRMKFMIVGQENVGKTSLLQCLLRQGEKRSKKAEPPKTLSTDGIDHHKYLFQCPVNERGKPDPAGTEERMVTLSAWDFGGQEVYYTTHQFFLSRRSVFVVTWNLSLDEEFCRVEYWLQSVLARAKGCRIILVGTHLDHPKCTPEYVANVLAEMKAKYSKKIPGLVEPILTVSSATGENMDRFQYLLQNVSLTEKTMGESLPNSYLQLELLCLEEAKTRKASGAVPVLSWDHYKILAETCGIDEAKQLNIATQLLHNLGSLVHFPGDENLGELVVLDPTWLTEFMATIVTTKHHFIKDGKIGHQAFKQLWRAPKFPPELHSTLFGIMQKFEVIYRLDSGADFDMGVSVVPSLLPEKPTSFESEISAFAAPAPGVSPQYGRQYRFEFLPHGLFSRLTIRMHTMLNVATAWKRGVLVKTPGGFCLTYLEAPTARRKHTILNVIVRGEGSQRAYRLILEVLESLTEGWYNVEPEVCIFCSACIEKGEMGHDFPLVDCERMVMNGSADVTCTLSGVTIPMDVLVPDILMVSVAGKKLRYSDLIVENKIGEGGFADVFRGEYLGDTVAIKKLKFGEETEDPEMAGGPGGPTALEAFSEFRREVFIMANLNHPCLCVLSGFSMYPPSIVCEFVGKGDLYTFLHREKGSPKYEEMTEMLRLRMALDMAKGMRYLHTREPPIIHRDLKSPNVLLATTDLSAPALCKVADFGLSQTLSAPTAGRAVANPVWLAPEVMDKKPYTEKADVYSFGVMMWELLTRADFFGECSFMSQIEEFVLDGERPPIPPGASSGFVKILEASWAQESYARPSFDTIVNSLRALVAKCPGMEAYRKVASVDPVDEELASRKRKSILHCVRSVSAGSVGGGRQRRLVMRSFISGNLKNDESPVYEAAFEATSAPSLVGRSASDYLRIFAADRSPGRRPANGRRPSATSGRRPSGASARQAGGGSTIISSSRRASATPPVGHRTTTSPPSVTADHWGQGRPSHSPTVGSASHGERAGKNAADKGKRAAGGGFGIPRQFPLRDLPIAEESQDSFTSDALNEALAGPADAAVSAVMTVERPVLPARVECCCIVEEGDACQIWVACANGMIVTFASDSNAALSSFNAHKGIIFAIARVNGQVWSSGNKSVKSWSVSGKMKKEYSSLKLAAPVTCITSAGPSTWAAAKREIVFFDSKGSFNKKKRITLESGEVLSMLFHNATMWIGTTTDIARASVQSMSVTSYLNCGKGPANSLVSVGADVWSAHHSGVIAVWDGETAKKHADMQGSDLGVQHVLKVGSYIWAQCRDGSVHVWDAKGLCVVSHVNKDMESSAAGLLRARGRIWVATGRMLSVYDEASAQAAF